MSKEVLTKANFGCEIPLGRRVKEILDERGSAFSVPAFARRIDISKTMLYKLINGERPFTSLETFKIQEGLNVTLSRLKMEDNKKLLIQLQTNVYYKTNLPFALEMALDLLPAALGYTERYEILNSLGACYYHLENYKSALNTWLEAKPFTEYILENFMDDMPYNYIINNLILVYSKLKDFSSMASVLREVEDNFDKLPPRIKGTICYSQAMAAYQMGDMKQLELKMTEQLKHFQESKEAKYICSAMNDFAYMLFVVKKYKEAKVAFEKAIEFMERHEFIRSSQLKYIALKDYAKTLFKLGDPKQSIYIIQSSLNSLRNLSFTHIQNKFLLLDAIYANNLDSAKTVLYSNAVPELKGVACKILMDNCLNHSDAKGLISYYKIGNEIGLFPIWKLEEFL